MHSGKHRPLGQVFGWCTVDIILLNIVLLPSQDSVWMVHSGYHPLKHRPLRIVFGWCTVDIIQLKHRPLRIVFGWCTVDIIPLNIVLLG